MLEKNKVLRWFTLATILLSAFYLLLNYTVLTSTLPFQERITTSFSEVISGMLVVIFPLMYYRKLILFVFTPRGYIGRHTPAYLFKILYFIRKKMMRWMKKIHVGLGITTIVLFFMHIILSGFPFQNIFLGLVIILVIWLGLFGYFFKSIQKSRKLKKISYHAHSQLFTAVMIGVFVFFGHLAL